MAKRRANTTKSIDPETVADAIAKSVADGDIVNFRLLFASFSPARQDSPEQFTDAKYTYLLPSDDEREEGPFKAARAAAGESQIRILIERELAANRPAQLPADLVLIEGFKREPHPKIEVRAGTGMAMGEPMAPRDRTIVAIAADEKPADTDLPWFRRDDIGAIADFISGNVTKATNERFRPDDYK